MPEQPQWSERTLDMPPQDPWADAPTTPVTHGSEQHEAQRTQVQHPQPRTQHPGGGHTQAQHPGGAHTQVQHPGGAHTQVQHPAGQQTQAPHPGSQHTQVQSPATPQSPAAPQHPTVPPFGPHGSHPAAPESSPFSRGRARVTQRAEQYAADHEPTGTGWPQEAEQPPAERRPLSWHIRRLRRGSEWSNAPLIFAFVCWGIWVLSSEGSLVTPIIVLVTSVCVAAGVFALARLVGRLVLERQLGRVRHTARGAHMAAGVFLIGVGLAHLQQTEWVMDAVNWVTGAFS